MDFKAKVERAFEAVGGGARLIVKELYADGEENVFPLFDDRTGRYRPVRHYAPTGWVNFPWAGFLAAKLWLLYDYTGEAFFRDRAMTLARRLGPYLASQPHRYCDAAAETYYALCLGHEATGDEQLKAWALAATHNSLACFDRRFGVFVQHAGDCCCYIDQPFAFQGFFWAARFRPEFLEPIVSANEVIRTSGLIRPDGSTFHAVHFDPATGKPVALKTRQGLGDATTWTRGQAWGIHNFTNAFEATGEARFLAAAVVLADWYIAHIPDDFVPFYDFNDPDIPNVPRDSCSAALTANALLRLMRRRPELAPRYRPVVEGTVGELCDRYMGVGGILLHGSWGRIRQSWGIGRFPQEDVMPYGNNWFPEVLYRLLKDDWHLFRTL